MKGRETVVQACVTADSQLVGKTLKEAQINDETGMVGLVIKREKCLSTGDYRISVGTYLLLVAMLKEQRP